MELDELGIDIEAQNCLDQIQQESRTSADYDPSVYHHYSVRF